MSLMQDESARRFLALHVKGRPLLMPNAWDVGSARLLASLGFEALATTSSGAAASRGLLDGAMSREEALAHAGVLAASAGLPVSADLEHGFARSAEAVAETYRLAAETGVAGASIEDFDRDDGEIYPIGLAAERVAAAAEALHARSPLVLTARAENFLRGRPDLADTIARLRAYQEAGADVLYAPFVVEADAIARIVESVDRPVNHIVRPDGPTVSELAAAGVARISVGGAFTYAAYGAMVSAARELLESGTYGWYAGVGIGRNAVQGAFK